MEEQNTPILAVETFEEKPQEEPVQEEVAVKKSNWKDFVSNNFLALAILVAGALIAGSVLYTGGNKPNNAAQIQQVGVGQGNTKVDVSVDNDPSLGNAKAPVTMIEFSDFQCPFCRIFWRDSFAQLKKEYIDTGKVRFVYRDFPLSIHPSAEPSAEAAQCAFEQGKFWEFHDAIFSEEDKLGQGTTIQYTVNDIKNWAAKIPGLDKNRFNQCLDSGKYKDEVAKDSADGSAAGVSGTPSFFINGQLIVGAQPYSVFKSAIDQALKK